LDAASAYASQIVDERLNGTLGPHHWAHISLMVRSMAKSTENFFKTILLTYWKRCHWNLVSLCGSSRTAILH